MTDAIFQITPNNTRVFKSPIEKRDVLVRTGIIDDGNSLIHAIFHSHSRDYVHLSEKEKIKIVTKFRKDISNYIERNKWYQSTDIVDALPVQDEFTKYIEQFYDFIIKNKKVSESYRPLVEQFVNKSDKEVYKILFEMIPYSIIKVDIIDKKFKDVEDEGLDQNFTSLLTYLQKYLIKLFDSFDDIEIKRKKYCVAKFTELFQKTSDFVIEKMYAKHIQNIKNLKTTADSITLSIISEKLKRNIYILDHRSRMPIKIGDNDFNTNTKCIILIQFSQSYYEVVGKLLKNSNIQREFLKSDPIIQEIESIINYRKMVRSSPSISRSPQNSNHSSPQNSNHSSSNHSSPQNSNHSSSSLHSSEKSASPHKSPSAISIDDIINGNDPILDNLSL